MRAAFFDVDGTLTDTRVWEGLMAYFKVHGLRRWTHRAFWAYHIPHYLLLKARLISQGTFRRPWAAHLAWYLRGYTPQEAEKVWDWVVEEFLSRHWRQDTRRLLDDHRAADDLVMLVSAGPQPLLNRIAREVGAGHVIATEFALRHGRYTGHSLEPVCIDENKAALAKAYLAREGIEVDFRGSHAYADAISDLHLLEMVGNPVVVYADEELKGIAEKRGWRVFPADR
jgi:HAD superfamily hydrolase (TIGR01490 family)